MLHEASDELVTLNAPLAGKPAVPEEGLDAIADLLLVVMPRNKRLGPTSLEDTFVQVVAGVKVLRFIVSPRSRDLEGGPLP